MNNQFFVIFGAPDFEEQKAREICKNLNIPTATATFHENPCTAGNASKANGFVLDEGCIIPLNPKLILFECGEGASLGFDVVIICDHHKPNDPGFGFPPERFWEGSSIGQLCNFLQVEPTPELLLVAAADHCPAAAYRGLCPGIDPVEFSKFRLGRKIEFFQTQPEKFPNKQTFADLVNTIHEAQQQLKQAPQIEGFKDVRALGYVDELLEAAFGLGVAYISETQDRKTGEKKIVCGGHTTPEMIQIFQTWASSLDGVSHIYGDPVRGFAGAVFEKA